jgi:hypothetical protein
MQADSSSPGQDAAAALLAGRIARLEVLVDVGLGLTRRLARDADEVEVGRLDVGAVALAYSRLAKAVRQTIALQARLEADAAAGQAAEARPFWEAPARPPLILTRRDKAVSAVELAIDLEAGESEAKFERLDSALADELEDLDDDVFDERPIGAIVVEICEALGVEPDLSLWEDEDWAIEEARTGAVGSPYARGLEAAGLGTAGAEAAGLDPDAAATAVLEHPPP